MNKEKLLEEIRRVVHADPTGPTAELLNRCYVALGEPQCQHGNWMDCAKCDTPSPVQSAPRIFWREFDLSELNNPIEPIAAPVAKQEVVMPSRLSSFPDDDAGRKLFTCAWNACLDEVARLNAATPKPPVQKPVAVVDKHIPSAEIQWTEYGAELALPHGTELYAALKHGDDVARDAARYRWLRHMTTRERIYIVQQVYDKTMDDLLDESMAGGGV